MKITCILTSYNRPNWIKHSLKSVESQTHRDYQLIVLDESSVFNIRETVKHFHFPEVEVHHFDVSPEQRRSQNRLAINMNFGLGRAKGDLICFLCDDDYYYPDWFFEANRFFLKSPYVMVAFGKLTYSISNEMVFNTSGTVRFHNGPTRQAFCNFDHNQVIHRRFQKPYRISEDMKTVGGPDGWYFRDLSKDHVFYPIESFAAVKRNHSKCLQRDIGAILSGTASELREP